MLMAGLSLEALDDLVREKDTVISCLKDCLAKSDSEWKTKYEEAVTTLNETKEKTEGQLSGSSQRDWRRRWPPLATLGPPVF